MNARTIQVVVRYLVLVARVTELRLDGVRYLPYPVSLCVLFVMDTTGSVGYEIARWQAGIEIIRDNLAALKPKPVLRLGMVLYRNQGASYVTSLVAITDDPDALRHQLDQEGAGGAKLSRIGTGGPGLDGECQLRQIPQLTDAKHIFLTYGETGEPEDRKPGSANHHTGANWQAEKLETIIMCCVKEEVAYLLDETGAGKRGYLPGAETLVSGTQYHRARIDLGLGL